MELCKNLNYILTRSVMIKIPTSKAVRINSTCNFLCIMPIKLSLTKNIASTDATILINDRLMDRIKTKI